MCPSATRIETIRALVDTAMPEELPGLAGELGRALAAVLMRSTAKAAPIVAPSRRELSSELLTVDEAAARLGVEKTWLYRHAKSLTFSRKLGHRTLRFDARGLEQWASTRPRV